MATENTHYGAAAIEQMLSGCRHIFFIGIGGINMSALARITANHGFTVSGSDRMRTALTEQLKDEGIHVYYSHTPRHIKEADAVVYTVAIDPDNPELVAAQERGIPCISRADYLGYLMSSYQRRIGISGMHGKSTCTSMCAQIFLESNPTIVCGAEISAIGGACRIGEPGKYFLFEACEYMDSFLDFEPNIAVILNIEMDHVDYFHSMEQIKTSFAAFAAKTGPRGYVVANADDENVMSTLENYEGKIITFGVNTKSADYAAVNISSHRGKPSFDIFRAGEFFCHIQLNVPGRHNIYNALAAAAVANICRMGPNRISAALDNYGGAKRRMEYKGTFCGADVYDDYGHHPTEIAATLDGVCRMGYDRVFCVFQPHTYSRLAELFHDFAGSFLDADRIIIADVYAAREENTTGITSKLLAQTIGRQAEYINSFEGIAEYLKQNVFEGDVIIIMGAGDTYRLFPLMGLS